MEINLHPPCSAFPLAFLTVTLATCLLRLFRQSLFLRNFEGVLLVLSGLAVMAAFFSGYNASEHASQTFSISDEVIATHHNLGRILLFSMIPCVLFFFASEHAKFSRAVFRGIYCLLLIACFALVILTGYRGGELVFVHGAGVVAR